MRIFLFVFTILFSATFYGCSEEQHSEPVIKIDENKHPRLSELNPGAWEGLPMDIVISDFQQSDGIFSSFICDEINKRLSTDPSVSLNELKSVDKQSRIYVFKICFYPEGGEALGALEEISKYSDTYPVLIKEITEAAK